MEMSCNYYFAYGSNMDLDRMQQRVGLVAFRIPGLLRDWQLTFSKIAKGMPGAGYANITPSLGDVVEGIVYMVDSEQIKKLDCVEGVHCGDYEHSAVKVISCNIGKLLPVFVYIACAAKVAEGLKPTKDYLNHLLAGREFLSDNYVQRLKAIETID